MHSLELAQVLVTDGTDLLLLQGIAHGHNLVVVAVHVLATYVVMSP